MSFPGLLLLLTYNVAGGARSASDHRGPGDIRRHRQLESHQRRSHRHQGKRPFARGNRNEWHQASTFPPRAVTNQRAYRDCRRHFRRADFIWSHNLDQDNLVLCRLHVP